MGKTFIGITISCLWLLAVGASGLYLIKYETTAGPQSRAQDTFPKLKDVQPDPQRCTLLLFAHPQCPCTRATINELNRVLTHCSDRVNAHVFFLKPSGVGTNWVQTDLWRNAESIPGVKTHFDADGAIAAQFGADTSGYVVLYSPRGKLLFRGGITSGRGHEGDNVGASSLIALANGATSACNNTPVYGCLLQNECQAPPKESTQ